LKVRIFFFFVEKCPDPFLDPGIAEKFYPAGAV